MKAKSLFMFETTYNYHEENFSVQGIIQLKRNTNVFNTLESQPQIIFMTQSVSESHTIQKERRRGDPISQGEIYSTEYWNLNASQLVITFFFLFPVCMD